MVGGGDSIMKCRCCQTPKNMVMAPLCDRCFLGWNNCCPFRISLDQAIIHSAEHTCEELGFYKVPFSLQIKHINRRNRKEREAIAA